MLLTLLDALKTDDLKTVVGYLDMSPLDIDLLLYEAQENGEVEINKEKAKIKALKPAVDLYYDKVLAVKIIKIIKRYDDQEANITRSRLEEITLNLQGKRGYPIHDFVCTMHAIENGLPVLPGITDVKTYEISVPAIKKPFRPANTFIFYTLLDHQEFGSKAVNDFIAQWDKLNTEKKK